MPRDEVVAYLERYAASFSAPIRPGVEATEVRERPDGGYRVETTDGPIDARAVVVATGTFQRPSRPQVGALAADILELHTSQYRNPAQLPPGGVLVIGSGQSGTQIAEELHREGRDVVLATGSAGRFPRRYRGADIMRWAAKVGFYERRADSFDDPRERFRANAHVSGRDGGHTINLHRFAHDGIALTGRITGIDGGRVTFGDDLHANLRKADETSVGLRRQIEQAIAQGRIEGSGSPDDVDEYAGTDGYDQPPISELDLRAAGIETVIWAGGYAWDFSWVRPATFDAFGYPIQRQGVTDAPGIYFLGLHFMDRFKSGLLVGVGDDAKHIAEDIAARLGARATA
jgi:putative flavoprotein involved in K+ transport